MSAVVFRNLTESQYRSIVDVAVRLTNLTEDRALRPTILEIVLQSLIDDALDDAAE